MSSEKKLPLKTCFVISPIGEEGSETRRRSDQVLKHIIKPATEACGYLAVRADEIDKPGLITSQVIQHVVTDALVIADLTEMNPNVFYELALRHAVRKPLVQIIEKGQRIPFDVAGTRTIHVDHKDLDSVDNAKKEIIAQINALEAAPDNIETPISVSLDLQKLTQSENPADRNLGEILAEISEVRLALTKISEIDSEKSAVEVKKLRQMIEMMLDRREARFWNRPELQERTFHILSMESNRNSDPISRALAWASIANMARDRIPWVYEGAIEVFKSLVFKSPAEGTRAEEKFKLMARQAIESPLSREVFERDKGSFQLLDFLNIYLTQRF